MRGKRLWIVAIAGSLWGCTGQRPPQDAGPRPPPPPASASLVCATRLLGATSEATCPELEATGAGRWKGGKVFPKREGLPASMTDLCAYDFVGEGSPKVPEGAARLFSSLGCDDPVVEPQQSRAWSTAMVTRLGDKREAFLAQTGAVRGASPSSASHTPIAVLDTSPTSAAGLSVGLNPHGFNVGWIAHLLSCPEGPAGMCLSAPRSVLALPLQLTPSGGMSLPPTGGSFGSRTQVATALVATVQQWLADHETAPIVLNLSIGWEPSLESGLRCVMGAAPPPATGYAAAMPLASCPAGMTPGDSLAMRAVFDALAYAACAGSLPIAAAGNDPGFWPPLSGAVLPAAWESVRAPTPTECSSMFSSLTSPSSAGSYRPLVHAVGGVTGTDAPLAVTRRDARPRLVAPSSMAIAYPAAPTFGGYPADAPSADSHLLSGTSAAAAVTSAAAAAVWALRPSLSAAEVMDAVYASGIKLSALHGADLCLAGQACDETRRVSVCAAIQAACNTSPRPAGCPTTLPACAPPPAFAGLPYVTPAPSPRPTPFMALPLRPPTIDGQPTRPGCPDCALLRPSPGSTQEWTFTGQLDASWFEEASTTLLKAPRLDLYDARGGYLESLTMAPARMTPTGPYGVTLSGRADYRADAAKATLTFTQSLTNQTDTLVTQEVFIE